MKNLFLIIALALGLSACATIPQPKNAGDSLLVGSIVLEFPDGFLGQPARTIASNLLLHFRDVSRNTRFVRPAVDGYFYFLGNGSDDYRLESYEYSYRDDYGEYYLNDSIGQSFSAVPGKLVDVGRIIARYEKPRLSNRVTFAQVIAIEEEGMFEALNPESFPFAHRTEPAYWRYDRTIDRRWDDAAVIAYLQRREPRSPWLQAELTH
jgi:hypothetical protein